jgi:hypothetical protein
VTLAPKGLLIEEQRTQLLLRSEEFDNAAWLKSNMTVTANNTVAPNGTTTADKLIPNTSVGTTKSMFNASPVSVVSGSSIVGSVWVKAGGYTFANVVINVRGDYTGSVCVNLTTGATSDAGVNGTYTVENVGDGWFRVTATSTASTTNGYLEVHPRATAGAAPSTFTGNGTDGIFIWGAQLEAGAFATSYIPTVASQVTRAADNASMIGNNFARWYNQTEGTLFTDSVANTLPSFSFAAQISDGTDANRIGNFLVGVNATAQKRIGGVSSAATVAVTNMGNMKIATAINAAERASSINGSAASVGALAGVPNATLLSIGAQVSAGGLLNSTIKRIAYYNRRLANTELTALTS